MTTTTTNEQGGGVLLLVAAIVMFAAFSGSPNTATTSAPQAAPPTLGPTATGLLGRVREVAKANPDAARKLGVMLATAGDMVGKDTNGAAITTTDQVFRYVERAERLYVTGTDGVSKLPGVGDAVSAVLKSPDVFGPTNAALDPAKRRAGADALKAIGDVLRGAL